MRKLIGFVVGAIDSVVALVGTATASRAATHQATAKKPITSGFSRGRTDQLLRLRPDQAPLRQQARADLDHHEPSTRDSTTSSTPFPGRADYTPLWQLNQVTVSWRLAARAALAQRRRRGTRPRRGHGRRDEDRRQLPRARLRAEARRRLLAPARARSTTTTSARSKVAPGNDSPPLVADQQQGVGGAAPT